MKRVNLAFSVLVMGILAVTAQKKQETTSPKYKWIVSAGTNIVDVRRPDEFAEVFKDHIGFSDRNIGGVPVFLTAERKLGNAFGVQVGASLNQVTRDFHYNGNDETLVEKDFMAFDAKLNFDLNSLIGETSFFDPFLSLGGAYSEIGDKSDFKLHAGYGANLWLTDEIGIKLASGYNHAFNHDATDYFQHTIGLSYRFGLTDKDKDGVEDAKDKCPDTPGLKQFDGCPDTDNDGVPDKSDKCPKEPGIKGLAGCPDADGDMVIDRLDKCPEEKGSRDNNGCPWGDADNDGIKDNKDRCPKEAGLPEDDGCPKVDTSKLNNAENQQGGAENGNQANGNQANGNQTNGNQANGNQANGNQKNADPSECIDDIKTINSTEIYFDFDKDYLNPSEKAKLDKMVGLLKNIKCSVSLVVFSGYADSTGSASYNLSLSERRALKVREYLKELGIVNIKMDKKGLGETKTRKVNKYNRRVEINVQLEQK